MFVHTGALLVGGSVLHCAEAAAQCRPVWSALETTPFGTTIALATVDEDGAGPAREALFAGGYFQTIGGEPFGLIGRWDGWGWSPLGTGFGSSTGNIRMVDGVGEGEMMPSDVGVYAGGSFTSAGAIATTGIALWRERTWFDLAGGADGPASDIQVFDEDGSGPKLPALYVGGSFWTAGGLNTPGFARWDGQHWSAVPGWEIGGVKTMAIFDGGSGSDLYAGGSFTSVGGIEAWNIARWDGRNWSPLDLGATALVESMCVFDDDGSGPNPPVLYVGGDFPRVGNRNNWLQVNGLARWDGQQWSRVPGWFGGTAQAMAIFDEDGAGPRPPALFVGGNFYLAGATNTTRLAKWDGQTWTALPPLTGAGAGTNVRALTVLDEDGDGPNPGGLYVGGYFTHAGGVPAPGLARWGCPLPQRCYADCDPNGILDIFDFLCFQNSFVAGDPYACECDPDPACDIFDFLCFQNAFVTGCP